MTWEHCSDVVGWREAREGSGRGCAGGCEGEAAVRRGDARGCDMRGARAVGHPNCTRRAGKKAAAPKAEEAPAEVPAETPAAE